MADPKCNAYTALTRARAALGLGGCYWLGTGDYTPADGMLTAAPGGKRGTDCAGFAICHAWMLRRHRPGFNAGSWATVSDDINVNSAIEDGLHKRELFTTLDVDSTPRPGDLLCYPTFRYAGREFIGHVVLVEEVPPDFKPGDAWHRVTVLQSCGPNGRAPAVVRTDASCMDKHRADWPKVFTDAGVEIDPRVRVVRPNVRQ